MFAKIVRKRHVKLPDRIAGPSKVKVGLPAGKADGSIIEIGVWNHFGTSRGIPERPFLSNAMRDNREKYKDQMAKAAKRIIRGELSMSSTLSQLGALAQGDIQAEIVALKSPPNAPSTIRQKGSDNPLVDTGRLGQSITYQVDD